MTELAAATYGTATYTGVRVIGDDTVPAAGRVLFRCLTPDRPIPDPDGTISAHVADFPALLDTAGRLQDDDNTEGVRLLAGYWQVTLDLAFQPPRSFVIEVPAGGIIDLGAAAPISLPDGTQLAKGDPGDDGPSVYEVWLDAGNTGTVDDFFATLKGADGDPGPAGGVSAVNGKTGTVVLTFSDLGAQPAGSYATTQALSDGLATKVNNSTYVAGIASAKDRAQHTGTQTSATISDLVEAVQDIVGGFFGAVPGQVTYNDAANTITITPSGSTDPEAVRDAIGVALLGVGNISVTVNDAGDTITLATSATANSTDAALRDRSTHTGSQPVSTISDSTAVGRSVVTATDAAAARAAIGAAAGDDTRIVGAAQRALIKRTITGAYTLVVADATDIVLHSTASAATTITLPTDSSVAIGQEIAIPWRQYGTGQLTFAAASGATVSSYGNVLRSAGQYAEGVVTKVGSNAWLVTGNLVT